MELIHALPTSNDKCNNHGKSPLISQLVHKSLAAFYSGKGAASPDVGRSGGGVLVPRHTTVTCVSIRVAAYNQDVASGQSLA